MPAISNSNIPNQSADEILQAILQENYPESPSILVFKRFLNATLMELDCDRPPEKEKYLDFNCHSVDSAKNIGVHYHLMSILSEGKLDNLLEFFTNYILANKATLADKDIENLILLGNHYNLVYEAKLNKTESIFSENDIKTTSSFINFLNSLFNIHNITEFETPKLIHQKIEGSLPNITFTDTQGIDTIVGHSNQLILNIIEKLRNTAGFIYKKESLLDFLQNLGGLGFKLKLHEEFAFQAEQIQNIAQNVVSSTRSQNFSDAFKKSAAWEFLNKYHDKNANDVESDCRDLFKLENCLPPDNENTRIIYEKVLKNKSTRVDLNEVNFELLIDKFSQGTSDNFSKLLHSLSSTNKLTNFINFFKDYLKQNNTLNEVYLKKTFNFCNAFNEIATSSKTLLRNTDDKLDIKYYKMIQAQIALVLNLVKSNTAQKLLIHQTQMVSQLCTLVVDVIENYKDNKLSNLTDESLVNIPKSYLDIINYAKDFDSSLIEGAKSFANAITQVTKACLNSNVCNTIQLKKQSFEMLGGMTRKLDRAHRIYLAKEVINSAKELKNIVARASNISDSELGMDVANFLRMRHARNQVLMDKDCKDLFDLKPENCRPIIPSNVSNITTTPISETIINNATHIPTTPTPIAVQTVNTTIAPAINQTTSIENSAIQNVSSPVIDDIFSNPADSIKTENFTFISKIGTAMGLGAFTGFLNGGSQIILHIAEQKNCSLQTQRFLAATLAIANSFAISSLPLIYSIVENFANDETDSLVNSQKLLTCTYAFITSMVLQIINAGMQYTLPKKSILKNLFNMLPVFASLWMLANSDESAIESLAILGANILTALATSSLTYFGLNLLPANRRHYPVETTNEIKDVELKALNTKGENIESQQPIKENVKNSKQVVNTDVNKQTNLMYFIQSSQLEEIHKKLSLVKLSLTAMLDTYSLVNEKLKDNIQTLNKTAKETNIEKVTTACLEEISTLNNMINDNDVKLKLINSHGSTLDTYVKLFLETKHLNACEAFTTAENLINNNHVKSLWGLIRTTLDNSVLGKLEKDLCKITGTDPNKLIAGPDFLKNSETLRSNISDIKFYSSHVESIFKGALRIYESKEQGVTAAKKLGVQNNENGVNINTVHDTATFRRKNNGIVPTNRAQSMYSDRTRSSGSDTSGNSEFDPLFEQQQRDLIRPRS